MPDPIKVAIIGSGATGLAAAKAAIRANCSVDLIDSMKIVRQTSSSNSARFNTFGALAKKSRFGSTEMYNYPSESLSFDKRKDIPLSSTFGGLTTVWGANVWFPKLSELELHPDDFQSYITSEQILANELNLLGQAKVTTNSGHIDVNQLPHSRRMQQTLSQKSEKRQLNNLTSAVLAVEKKKCTECGLCLTGCPQDAIFSAEIGWRTLISEKKINVIKGFAEVIENNNTVKIIDQNNGESKVQYDKIYIACGAIATSALLQRSSLIPPRVFLNDTQVFYLPILNWRRSVSKVTNFTLAQLFYRSADIKEGMHLSIYENSADIISRAKNKISFFSILVPQALWKHLQAGIGFIPPEYSGRICVEEGTVTFEDKKEAKKMLKKILKKEAKELRKSGLYPILLARQMPNTGASYHVGGLQDSEGRALLGRNGEVSGQNNIFVVDSSALKRIPVGPITISAMINADRIVTQTCSRSNS